MIKSRMRRSDIFKTLTACIIINDGKERGSAIEKLRAIGIKHFIYYPSFEAAYADFNKFFSNPSADFIITDNTNHPPGKLPVLTLEEPIDKSSIMQMFKRKFKI